MNKITNPMVSNRHKRKRLSMLSAFAMTLFMALFTQIAQAQTNVYMHSGTQTVPNGGSLNFYDSGGPSSPDYWWEKWYSHNENATLVFKNGTSPIKIEFKKFTAYDGNSGANIGEFSLRVNDDHLYIYEGETADADKLIVDLTGTISDVFTIMTNGPMTVKFVSNGSYREEGWAATVSNPATFTVPAPLIVKDICSDVVSINTSALGATIYYTTDGNDPVVGDPLTGATLYEGSFPIDLDDEDASVKVKAIAVVEGHDNSAVAEHTFTHADQRPVPGVPTITIEGNVVTMTPAAVPAGLNDTYTVRYTTNGDDPTANNGTVYSGPFEWTTPNTTFKAITQATECPDKISSVVTAQFGSVKVPTPVITFNADGTATITCSLAGATINYNIDGVAGSGTTPVTTAAVTVGSTVYATAHYDQTGYVDSDQTSAVYVPAGGNGTYGGVVFLDDREDHTWSYYSDGDQPIHSLNPADVKITYLGNGKMYTSTTATPSGNLIDATGVKVSATENEDTFIYLKTLERANGDAGTGNLAYTLIPNPFSVRPTFTLQGTKYYTGFYGWRVKSLNGVTISGYNEGSIIPAETEIHFVTNNAKGNEVEFEAVWARAYVTNSTSTSGLQASVGYERNFMVLGSNPGASSTTTQWPTSTSSTYTNGSNLPIYQYSSDYLYSLTQQIYTPAQVGEAGRITQLAFNVRTSQNRSRTLQIYITKTSLNAVPTTTNSSNETVYRTIPIDVDNDLVFTGTYNFSSTGWNTITLTTPFEYDGASNIVVSVFDNTNRTHSLSFYTYSSGGSKSCYFSDSSTPDLSQYYYYVDGVSTYNNQIRFVKTNSEVSALNVPLTMTTYNPDGTGGSSTVTLSNSIHAAADIKFENIKMNAIPVLSANGHNLIVGRGVTPSTSGGVCASYVKGLNANATSPNYKIRLESGTYTTVSMVDGYYGNESSLTISGTPKVSLVLGNDYDRATEKYTDGSMTISNNLNVTEGVAVGRSLTIGSSSMIGEETFKTWVKSGKICSSFSMENFNADFTKVLYMSSHGSDTYAGYRKLFIEGGEISAVSGGMDACYTSTTTNSHTKTLTVRMTNGHIRSAIYGGAAQVPAGGDKEIIVTGGVVTGWIGAGCNGTTDTDGQTYGEGFVYFGGDAISGGDGSSNLTNGVQGGVIFGAGAGRATSTTTGEMTFGTNVVIADECNVEHNVYGGGNYGYAVDHSNVYVLGGTIQGSVFGGANQKQGPVVNVTMTKGTVNGSIYGGSNTTGTIAGLATINLSGGTVTNVYGGGLGASTSMAAGTKVNISGGTINNNVYGGGELGTVTGNTNVTVSGGTMKDVYGAGKGGTSDATISGQTFVNVTGGTIANVYGGGENGKVAFADGGSGSGDCSYSEDFEGYTGTAYNTAGPVPSGWDVIFTGNTSYSSYSPHVATGIYYDYVISSGNGFCFTSGSNNYGSNNYAILPIISGEITEITFKYRTESSTNGTLSLGYITNASDASTYTILTTFSNSTTQGTDGSYSFTNPIPEGARLAFRWYYNSSFYTCGIDDICVKTANNDTAPTPASLVAISGGNISGDVFGGGKLGTTTGAVTTNVSGGNVRGNVFGGAYGAQGSVYVTGQRTVNMTGGHVYGNVYGGSRNANDGNSLDLTASAFDSSTETGTISVTNISGGIIDQNVYAAGYYGNTFGSVYAFIGKNAIENAPNHSVSDGVTYTVKTLNIAGNVWAGGDWGTFEGSFGDATISGNSNIYVDGTDYETETTQTSNAQYMNIGGSILGSGTSCHAGKGERTITIRNYGHADGTQPTEATRTLYSIQLAKLLVIDNANINFAGQGKINSLNTTETYAIYEISNGAVTDSEPYGIRLVNGSGLFLNAPVAQIANFKNMSCNDVYTATIDGEDYVAITPTTLPSTPNKIRVNGGNYIEIRYGSQYGALIGYAYMMASTGNDDGTCAYARPKNCATTPIANNLNNPNDGGWVSYNTDENTFDLDGNEGSIQMPYENHTVRNGEQYFRIWRIGGDEHYREGVFDAVADGTATYSYVDVVINLPAYRDSSNYYRFERTADHNNYTVSYGADVLTFNSALTDANSWVHIENGTQTTGASTTAQAQIEENPNVNFGLVGMPSTGMGGNNYIICSESEDLLIADGSTFPKEDNTKEPEFIFRLTYYNKLSANMTWDPMTIVLVQCDASGNVVDRVTISLAVNTSASIEQEFTTQVYAIMQGKGSTSDTYDAKVVLPRFTVAQSGVESNFTVKSVTFAPANGGNLIARGGSYTYNDYAVTYAAGYNYDNTDGWYSNGQYVHQDAHDLIGTSPTATSLGHTGGRTEFSIDFRLHYNGLLKATQQELIGTLTFNITFDNYKDSEGVTHTSQPLTIIVEVYRRGQGSKFYLDGVNGSNGNDARHPDKAVTSLSTIFNRCGYLAGDEIYIVNQISPTKAVTWNGLPYSNVTVYRYDGGHELSSSDAVIVDNENNEAYTGVLLNVSNTMEFMGITLDGHYNGGSNQIQTGVDENDEPVYGLFTPVTAAAPLINIANGGTVELGVGTVLQQNNNNTSNGGAVCVNEGGTLMMNQDAQIINNVVSSTMNGGGVYMDGTMVVSDNVKVIDNKQGTVASNVNLTSADQVIQIGTDLSTDDYDALGADAQIGITKEAYANYSGYTRVVYVETQTAWLETPYQSEPNAIIFHDGHKYQLVKFTPDNYLYWIGTWVTVQDHVPTTEEGGWPYDASTTEFEINTEYQLAWIISMVNGENGCTPDNFSGKTVTINDNIDMTESIWVPIGTTATPFKGTFEGNGHAVLGVHSPLEQTNLAMFANTENAVIKDMVAMVNFDANATNMATLVANMNGNTVVSNVEAAGTLTGGAMTEVIGGIAANVAAGATIHSSLSVATIAANNATEEIGGLIGVNNGNLFNAYSNCEISGGVNKGGLVGTNKGVVENCYTILGKQTYPAFAVNNNGTIQYCYADKDDVYVANEETGSTLTGHGTYDPVLDRKAYGYMYNDNKVNATNSYVASAISYAGGKIDKWPGLLSTLNQWVKANPRNISDLTPWFRPTSQDINGDLPVLGFPKDNCLATTDGRFLQYSSNVGSNGIDLMLSIYSGQTANIFLYGVATDVEEVPGANVNVFVNEDAVLLQKQGAKGDFINTTVGVTFDNSSKTATDYWGNTLEYDWHLLSTPLSNAPLGISYSDNTAHNWWENEDQGQVADVQNSYMPDHINSNTDNVTWDFYTYYEPEYHWINFKRNINSHNHYDEPHANIPYSGFEQTTGNLIAGRGYMMAISQDSYLNNTGTLNNGTVTIPLTVTGELPETDLPSKDWGSNLVGNPYQAYLNLDIVADKTGQRSFYVYDADNGVYGPYMTGASINSAIPSKYIHPHQAFFVVTQTAQDNFAFTYEMATDTTNETSYYRGEEQPMFPLVNLFVQNEAGNRDLAIVEFNRPELGGVRKVDNLRNANFKLSAYLEGQNYGLLFTPEGTERVPVHFRTREDGTFTLTWQTMHGTFTNLMLVDNLTGVRVDMLRNDHYTFEGSVDDYAARFYITFNVTDVEELNGDGEQFAWFDGNDWIINGKGQLQVIDVTGRVLQTAFVSGEQTRLHLNGVAAGVYVMRLTNGTQSVSQKIVVK